MKFLKIDTGTIFDVKNESLLPQYEGDERFKKVDEPVKEEKADTAKKTTTKKK